MTQTLTEQWENKVLPCGNYYIELDTGATVVDFFGGIHFERYYDDLIEKILAPVPTFEEWQVMEKKNETFQDALEDIGYCKSWIYQNRPSELVSWALGALKGRHKPKIVEELESLQTQLKIAREALQWFIREDMDGDVELDLIENGGDIARQALAQMDELKGGK